MGITTNILKLWKNIDKFSVLNLVYRIWIYVCALETTTYEALQLFSKITP